MIRNTLRDVLKYTDIQRNTLKKSIEIHRIILEYCEKCPEKHINVY